MFRSPFTASQWQELEQQALILKYLLAGVPVPPDLVFSISRSFGSMPASFYANPTLGYDTYFGKKLDPEPGRCRRTDGKKWRCSKNAYPDSKYCERHVHRKKNSSRKPVESQSISQLQPSSSSTATSLTPDLSISGSIQNSPLQYSVSSGGSAQGLNLSSYGTSNKDYRYLNVAKADVDMHSFISEASGSSTKGLGLDPSLDSTTVVSNPQLHSMLHDFGQQHHSSYLGSEFGLLQPVKQENNSLRPLFDEWQRTGYLWSELDDERSNQISLSNTQLSISIPMPSSDSTMGASRSSNNDRTRNLMG